jgi:hypothetical protein
VALVHIPLTAFYVDDTTGIIWGPDPTGSVVSPDGLYRLAPQTPTSSSTDPATGETHTTYAGPTEETAQAAAVPIPPPPGSSSSSPAVSSATWLSRAHLAWTIGAAVVAALVLKPRRSR